MAVATIRDLPSGWRGKLLPASFDGKMFHAEAGSREGGRRIVSHEFPKKDLGYSEDMGRKITEFSVRGYIIQFVRDTAVPLYQRDYTKARDLLQARLDTGGAGTLQLPMMNPLTVVCSRYRMTEEDKTGGFVVFDMTFVELGAPPFKGLPNAPENLLLQSQALRDQVVAILTPSAAGTTAGPRVIAPSAIAGGKSIALPQPQGR
jgi:prophage DNA circulation protein